MHFFGKQLVYNGSYYHWNLDKNAMVICWDDGKRWSAKLAGSSLTSSWVVATGKTPREALRKLERKTLSTIRQLVKTFAVAFRELGNSLLKLIQTPS